MHPERREVGSLRARLATSGFILGSLLGTIALAAPRLLEVLGVVAVLALFVGTVIWIGGDMVMRPGTDHHQQAKVRMLFVACCGDQLIVDGLRPTRSASGHWIETPFSLCLRRPETPATEAQFLRLLRGSAGSGSLEVKVNRREACFRCGEGQVVLPLTRTVGWP